MTFHVSLVFKNFNHLKSVCGYYFWIIYNLKTRIKLQKDQLKGTRDNLPYGDNKCHLPYFDFIISDIFSPKTVSSGSQPS